MAAVSGNLEAVHTALQRVLNSKQFAQSGSLSKLLRYVTEESLAGRGADIKEYTLGCEVFGRGSSFDPKVDGIVRVQASRLRGKLRDYYAAEGGRDEIRITVPTGGYAAQFLTGEERPTAAVPPPREREQRHFPSLRKAAPFALLAAIALLLASSRAWWAPTPRRNAEAEQAYKEGLDLLRIRDLKSIRSGAKLVRRAVELDPAYAKGWAGLAEAAMLMDTYIPDGNGGQNCLQLAERSVKLDPQCGECEGILGFILFSRYWKWQEAGDHLSRALRLSPADPQIRYWSAQREAILGRPVQALKLLDEAIEQSPTAFNLLVMKAGTHYFNRDYPAAVKVSGQLLALNLPSGWHWRTSALFQMGQHAEAVGSLSRDLGAGSARSEEWIALRTEAVIRRYHEAGLPGVLGDFLRDYKGNAGLGYYCATWLMHLGKPDEALDELEQAVKARVFNVMYLGVDPVFDPLRTRPRFQELLRQVGL
jgi:tetratricopeptide (TPR) repeat protein